MKHLFYFLFGILTAIMAIVFGVEHYGREFIQDYWIEQMWYGELQQLYNGIKTTIIIIYLMFIVSWTYMQGKNAAHEMKEESDDDDNNNLPQNHKSVCLNLF